jgi:hypothetical protein
VSLEKILPTIMIAINILSAIVYMSNGDYKRCIYWVAAAVLTATVTY